MLDLQRQLSEQANIIDRLERALQQQRELGLRQLRDTQAEADKRSLAQKADYEATIERNYKLIDEVIAAKKGLHEQCDKLVAELKQLKKRTDDNTRQLEER
ncbi:unnamed protein product [Protopolystoma xenopodis]|uniref:Uncharacterized protein n=1 Tax=Protopolystoma xenopodis TaxID=117903 RepID=A0A3S5BG26_9PLAT|nr:unnamed protein product [Protopolystoma xenopodis]